MSQNGKHVENIQRRQRPRVVIVGAGFAGLWAAKALADAPVELYLLDRHNYHTFLPLLYQVAAAEIEPGQIGYPIRAILRDVKNIHFILADVQRVDLVAQTVKTATASIPYDYLVLATGSISRFFGIPGAEEHAYSLKTMEEGIELRNHILRCFERANQEPNEAHRRRLLTFAVVGGGPTGVEYAGALSELIQGPLAKDYPELDLDEVRVVLLEAADRLLLAMPSKLSRYAVERLQRMGVEVRLRAMVNEVTPESVHLQDGGAIATETVVWVAGVQGEGVARHSGLPALPDGRVEVLPTLHLPDYANVYVAGDLAAFAEEDGRYLPMVAPVATQQGTTVAENIKRQLQGEKLRPFKYNDKGNMSTIGRNAAVAHIGGRALSGFVAWLIWLAVHLYNLIGFRNRIMVLINWAWSYFFYERVVRLIIPDTTRREGATTAQTALAKEAKTVHRQ